MEIATRVFSLYDKKYENLTELAKAMGISVSKANRVREGNYPITEEFIIGGNKGSSWV